MAAHFSANQYEQAFDGKRLQNWQLPHTYKERPSCYEGFTQVIANDRGHLLEGVSHSSESPWGTFVGTWDLPLKIPGNVTTFMARSDPAAKSIVKARKEHVEYMRQAADSSTKEISPKKTSPNKASPSPRRTPPGKAQSPAERPCNPSPTTNHLNTSTSPEPASKSPEPEVL